MHVTEMFDQPEKSMDIVFVVVLIKLDSLEFLTWLLLRGVTKTCVFKVLKWQLLQDPKTGVRCSGSGVGGPDVKGQALRVRL